MPRREKHGAKSSLLVLAFPNSKSTSKPGSENEVKAKRTLRARIRTPFELNRPRLLDAALRRA